ncbi:MAG TPA: TlpA disulfide reductase family protein [Thermoplasmata archaeon]|nr:TlpA disulfide reductase family protein [Thermoplasmata archaeon]
MPATKCPVCGVSVKAENVERHLRNQHPHAPVDLRAVLSDEEIRRVEAAKKAERPVLSRRGKQVAGIAVVVLAVVIVLAILNPFGNVGPGIGQIAPDFTRPTSTGGTVTLSSFRGFPVLLEFMDVDCPACQNEVTVLASVYADYSTRVRFLSVDVNLIGAEDTASRVETFRADHGSTWTYALDPDRSATRAYGITATPTTFILDRNGVVMQVFRGQAPGGYTTYAAALDAALGT